MTEEFNPYEAPRADIAPPPADILPLDEWSYAPCFKCGTQRAVAVRYTWWGGRNGARKFHHVRCVHCGQCFNGRDGGSNLKWILWHNSPILLLLLLGMMVLLWG